jgi:PAS domain S-box-containing protein
MSDDHRSPLQPEATARESDRIRDLEAKLLEAEKHQTLLTEAVPDFAMLGMDADGRITSWGDGARRLLGYEAEEVLGKLGSLLFTPEDRAAGLPQRELKTAAASGSAADENWIVRKDGSRFWGSGFSSARKGQGGELLGFVKILRDLTEREQALHALHESELRLQAALAAADMGTWLWQVPTDKQTLDKNLHTLLGITGGRTVHNLEDFLTFIHPDDRAQVREAFLRSVREGTALLVDFRVPWPDGTVRWLRDKGEAFRDSQGHVEYLTGACVDITDHKHMEEELREANRRKDEFLAMLGHELRNPLAPLRSVTEILRRQKLQGQDLERAYAMMDRQVSHLTRLIDDLLDVSRITRGLVDLRKESVDLAQVADQAVEMAAPVIEGRGHQLSVDLPRKPLQIEGDATRLTQVVFNLLNNAAKYTEPGGRIWLSVEREDGQAVVQVRDNGSGMPAELVPRVFDLFTQGERTLDRSQGGLGLGLTLVKRLVEMHGGRVEARSNGPGKGSEFVVRLPALSPEGTMAPPALVPGPRQAAAQVARALVVDDNFDVAESMTWMLEGLAKEIRMAHSGPQAIESARVLRPDIILCDIGMVGMDGYEACRRLRAELGLEKTIIAAVSGYGSEEDRRRSQEAGFDRHLVKPISRADLEELVRIAATW